MLSNRKGAYTKPQKEEYAREEDCPVEEKGRWAQIEEIGIGIPITVEEWAETTGGSEPNIIVTPSRLSQRLKND